MAHIRSVVIALCRCAAFIHGAGRLGNATTAVGATATRCPSGTMEVEMIVVFGRASRICAAGARERCGVDIPFSLYRSYGRPCEVGALYLVSASGSYAH